jgi:hypothetical protein
VTIIKPAAPHKLPSNLYRPLPKASELPDRGESLPATRSAPTA